jgi:hypothetical protein
VCREAAEGASASGLLAEESARRANPKLGSSVVHPDARSVQNRFARVIAFGELQHADHVIALVDCTSEVQIVHYATMRS